MKERLTSGPAIVLYIAAADLLLHLIAASGYGYFGDELYYLACARHLDWGYVDQPPAIVLLTWLVAHTLGTSLFAIHLLPALAGAGKIVIAGAIARELGGGRFAQALAALATFTALIFLAIDHLWTMNTFEPLIWMGCVLVVTRIIKTGDHRLWLWFGLLAGVGLETKYSMAVFGAAVVAALLLTPARTAFAHRYLWIAGAIAFALFLPNLLWNVQHHWPFLELMHNINESGRDIKLPPHQFILQQVLMMTPATAPVWIAGMIWLLASREAKPYRALGWIFLATFAFFLAMRAKDYYVAPAYPIAFAAGGVAWEHWLDGRRWLQASAITALVVCGALLAPYAVPLLPVDTFIAYAAVMPFHPAAAEHSHLRAMLPHHFAWRFGWPEMVAKVARVYDSLPPDERARTAIFGNNFAEAGAIDLLGPRYGLPPAIGGHQNYWLWGPRNYDGSTVIVLGDSPEGASKWFESVQVAAILDDPHSREHQPILLCRGLKVDLREAWPKLKDWD